MTLTSSSSYWFSYVPSVLWQIILHSFIAGIIFSLWSKRNGLTWGRARRQILGMLLILPVLTALVPGRGSFDFRERLAWMDSARILFLPLFGTLRIYHLVLAVSAIAVLATVWQELLPLLRRPAAAFDDVPEGLLRRARALPGWSRCRVGVSKDEGVFLATTGWPWRPLVLISPDAMRELSDAELEVTLLHEHAHCRRSRWLWLHALFLIRVLQCFNPVALWIFREYSLEVEVDCDAEAVAGRDPKLLARPLVRIYETTDPADFSSRIALRRRVDILLGRLPQADDSPDGTTVIAAFAVLMTLLPWVV